MRSLTIKIDRDKLLEMVKQVLDEETMTEIAKVFADYLEGKEAFKFPPASNLVIDPDRIIAITTIDSKYYSYNDDYTKVLKVKFEDGEVVKYIEADEDDMKIVRGDGITAVRVGKTYVNKEYLDKACKILSILYNTRFKRNDYSKFAIFYPKEPVNPLIVTYGNTAVFIAPLVEDVFIDEIDKGGD